VLEGPEGKKVRTKGLRDSRTTTAQRAEKTMKEQLTPEGKNTKAQRAELITEHRAERAHEKTREITPKG